MNPPKIPSLVADIRLFGDVDDAMQSEFFRQQADVTFTKPLVMEISTPGGNADTGRRIAQEVRMWRDAGADVYFLGKTFVYSAGVTIMSAFPQKHRFLTADCKLLIHKRKMKKDLHLEGALRGCLTAVNDVLAQIESGQRLEREGFAQLVEGMDLSVQDVEGKVHHKDWYLTAAQAAEVRLVAGIV